MNLALYISVIFVVVILYLIVENSQKTSLEKVRLSSRAAEIAAVSSIYQTQIGLQIAEEGNRTTAGDWIAAAGTAVDIVGMFYTGGLSSAVW